MVCEKRQIPFTVIHRSSYPRSICPINSARKTSKKKKTIFIFHVNRFLQIVNFLKCSFCPRGHQILKENVSAMVNILYFFCLIPTSFKNYDMINGFGDY